MGFVGRFNAGPADSIPDLVSLLREDFVLVFRDRLGVTEGMGRQRAMGIETQDVDIDLRPLQGLYLLLEAQDLIRLEIHGQGDSIAVAINAAATAPIQLRRTEAEQAGQAIPQWRPCRSIDKPGLEIEGVRELAGRQHPSFTIQQTSPNRRPRHQADSVLVSKLAVMLAVEHLQPGEASQHGAAEDENDREQHQRLLAEAAVAVALTNGQVGSSHGSGNARSGSQMLLKLIQPAFNSGEHTGKGLLFVRPRGRC